LWLHGYWLTLIISQTMSRRAGGAPRGAEIYDNAKKMALGVPPNAAYFLLGEPGQPVFVFAVSGLGTPASRRHTVGILTIQESTRQMWLHGYWLTLIISQTMSRRDAGAPRGAEIYDNAKKMALGVPPNAAYFLLGEPGQPVFVFAVSGLGTPASRRLAVGILTIQASTRQMRLHGYWLTLIISQTMSRQDAGAPRGAEIHDNAKSKWHWARRLMQHTFCWASQGNRLLFLQFPAWERRRLAGTP
jgi:hypothetical protein